MTPEEYITTKELSSRLGIKQKTIRNKMSSGIFKKGVHYFSPPGLGPRFKWSAIVAWLEEREQRESQRDTGPIPMAKGYFMGEPTSEKSLPPS